MTLVLGTKADARGLQQINFGINEVVSALTLSKHVGSLFSRKQDAQVFNVLQENYGISVNWIPPWLVDFGFARATSIHGSDMRRVDGPLLMQDIDLENIEGIAAIIVLIAKYVEPIDTMVELIENILTHRLPTRAIHAGRAKDVQQDTFRNWTPLLRSWVEAVLSADTDTTQALKTRGYLSELAMQGACAGRSSFKLVRIRQQNVEFIQDLLGSHQGEKDGDQLHGKLGHYERDIHTHKGKICKQRVFDTLAASTASIALAAAANGADVSVECIFLGNGQQQRKRLPLGKPGDTHYLVRLWLCTPPMEIYKCIRPTEASESIGEEGREDDGCTVIFGGDLEIALHVAQELDFWTGDGNEVHSERVLALWNAGIKRAATITWRIRRYSREDAESPVSSTDHLYLRAETPTQVLVEDEHVERLAAGQMKAWTRFSSYRSGMTTMHRIMASIVHEQYLYSRGYEGPIFQAAMNFVAVAIMIGMLDGLILKHARKSTYAFNMEILIGRRRNFQLLGYFQKALFEGLDPSSLLWAIASVWGGSSLAVHGHMEVSERVIGIVAPQCTVLLDFVRDPLRLAKHGLKEPIISLHYGSVPLLFRNPSNGFIMAAVDALTASGRRRTIGSTDKTTSYSDAEPECDLVIRLEPNITSQRTSSSGNYLVCYYMGDLAFELDPFCILLNLLLRRGDTVDAHGMPLPPALSSYSERRTKPEKQLHLGFRNLLDFSSFVVEYDDPPGLSFRAGPLLGWLVAIAGCAPMGSLVLRNGEPSFEEAFVRDVVVGFD